MTNNFRQVRCRRTFTKFHTRLVSTGLTLVEIMVALTVTLIVLGAMMTAFQYASIEMRAGRALMELANRVRSAETLMRSDLENLTLEPRPYAQTTEPGGYLEYGEGPVVDSSNAGTIDGYIGDIDDYLAMTVRSAAGQSFRGRSNGSVVESSLAEVLWYTSWVDLDVVRLFDFDPQTLTLVPNSFANTRWRDWNDLQADAKNINFAESVRVHRRVLLIRPDLGVLSSNIDINEVNQFLANNDISCRVILLHAPDTTDPEYKYSIVANNLGDLANRKNRFCHGQRFDTGSLSISTSFFPNRLDRLLLIARGSSMGDDILLTDVAGFDLKAYSPNANVKIDSDIVVELGDPGYDSLPVGVPVGALGAFIDLASDPTNPAGGWFSAASSLKSQCSYVDVFGIGLVNVFDTWTPAYESDGIDQDGVFGVDQATDGLDTDNANGVDDTGERETLPPYAHPIRGMKVTFRLIEKLTKQVHQSSVIQSFVPE